LFFLSFFSFIFASSVVFLSYTIFYLKMVLNYDRSNGYRQCYNDSVRLLLNYSLFFHMNRNWYYFTFIQLASKVYSRLDFLRFYFIFLFPFFFFFCHLVTSHTCYIFIYCKVQYDNGIFLIFGLLLQIKYPSNISGIVFLL